LPFPYLPDSDLATNIAALATVVATAAAVTLFCYTLLLRVAASVASRRRQKLLNRWRGLLAEAVRCEDAAVSCALPQYAARDSLDLLEEWSRFCATVTGCAAANLLLLGRRAGFEELAARLLEQRRLGPRLLGIRTLGHLRAQGQWDALAAHVGDPNTALSVTCAAALVEIDTVAALPVVMPSILSRVDWPPVTVAAMLRSAGAEHITIPICRAILEADPATTVRLFGYAVYLRPTVVEQLVETVLRERSEPDVIAAALKASPGVNGVPGLSRLVAHDAWYVRMQAARVLGRCARERDVPDLERLLADREWWVRYRAAQAIVGLPFLGPNALRAIIARQTDRYAIDMMHQAMAEAGL
jgi:hypothetical protein